MQIAQMEDIKRARQLLESVIKSNPQEGDAWLALARVEEVAGKTFKAQKVIQRGCENCPKNEDVWLEAVRLNSHENGKRICADAITYIPKSVKIWLRMMELEDDTEAKKCVLQKALEQVPQSVELWKEAVNLEENPSDAHTLLAWATELIPLSVELRLALARLETYQTASNILNSTRESVHTSHENRIAAVRLEEQQNNNN